MAGTFKIRPALRRIREILDNPTPREWELEDLQSILEELARFKSQARLCRALWDFMMEVPEDKRDGLMLVPRRDLYESTF